MSPTTGPGAREEPLPPAWRFVLRCLFAASRRRLVAVYPCQNGRDPFVRRLSRRSLLTTIAAAAITVPAVPAARAQESPTDFLPFLDGLVSAYARRYVVPPEGFPGATPATTSVTFLEATVLEFESPDMAKKAGALLNTDLVLPALTGIDDISIDDFEDAGLGDRSYLLVTPTPDEFEGLLIIFDGNLGFILTADGSDESMAETMLALGEFMVEAEPGSGEVDLTGGGQSSGGTWDTLPTAADSEILGGLVPVYDYDLLVSNQPIEPEASPAS
jgi:hypothetical protein